MTCLLQRRYIHDFQSGFDEGLKKHVQLSFMQSDGGLSPVSSFSGHKAILSGPAGGCAILKLCQHTYCMSSFRLLLPLKEGLCKVRKPVITIADKNVLLSRKFCTDRIHHGGCICEFDQPKVEIH